MKNAIMKNKVTLGESDRGKGVPTVGIADREDFLKNGTLTWIWMDLNEFQEWEVGKHKRKEQPRSENPLGMPEPNVLEPSE